MAICTTCGTAVSEGAKFCSNCGATAKRVSPACSRCGAELRTESRFCGQCGAPAVSMSSSDASPGQVMTALTANAQPRLRWNDWMIVGGASAAWLLEGLGLADDVLGGSLDPVVDLIGVGAMALLAVAILFVAKRFPSNARARYAIAASLGAVSMSLMVLSGIGSFLWPSVLSATILTGTIFGLIKPYPSPPKPQPGPRTWQAQPAMAYVVPGGPTNLGAPGIGIAGFVLSLLGISLLGIVLSWVGYAQARREGRPTSLCLAGIVIGFAWLAVGVALYIVFAVIASRSGSSY